MLLDHPSCYDSAHARPESTLFLLMATVEWTDARLDRFEGRHNEVANTVVTHTVLIDGLLKTATSQDEKLDRIESAVTAQAPAFRWTPSVLAGFIGPMVTGAMVLAGVLLTKGPS